MIRKSNGFTLVEMMVVAPIVILAIGAFIALIVNLTGEIMSSRGSNVLTYDIQNALGRIEDDIKLSSGFLATSSVPLTAANPQGRGAVNSTTPFTSSGVDGNALILNTIVTDGNPLSLDTQFIYLSDAPNNCVNSEEYRRNTPMTMNIVYFLRKVNTSDETYSLWRRAILPANYADTNAYCGSKAPWQQPNCINTTPRSNFCRTNDEELVKNIQLADFRVEYFTSAGSSSPVTVTGNASLQPVTTTSISLTSTSTIAGRDVTASAALRASRLDTNASAVGIPPAPATSLAAPNVSSTVSDGHNVKFTWPRVAGATSYTIQYSVNGGTDSAVISLDSNTREYVTNDGWNGDMVSAKVIARNSVTQSSEATNTTLIPLWSPLLLKGNWTDYGGTYGTAAYTKTRTGMIMFRGLIKNATYTSGGQVLATIPADYAPKDGRMIFGVSTHDSVSGRIDVSPPASDDPDAFANVSISVGSGSWISLESIRYDLPETRSGGLSPYARTNPGLLNSWANYANGYAPASYALDPTSRRVFTQGLVRYGTIADNTPIFALPSGVAPAMYTHLASRSTVFAGIGANTTHLLAKGNGTNGYLSLNSVFYSGTGVTWTAPTLGNGWVNYGSGNSTAGYTRSTNETANGTSNGVVGLRGLIRAGTTTSGTALFTLPAGHRPANRILYTVYSNTAYGRLDILPDGRVFFMVGSNGWYSLDGVTFLADGG